MFRKYSFLTAFLTALLAVAVVVPPDADAQRRTAYDRDWVLNKGVSRVDSLGWSYTNHAVKNDRTTYDTLSGTLSDTSLPVDIDGAEAISHIANYQTVGAGGSGIDYVIQVSDDGNQWTSLVATFSVAASAGASNKTFTRTILLTADADTTVTGFTRGQDRNAIRNATKLRVIATNRGGDFQGADTTFHSSEVKRRWPD